MGKTQDQLTTSKLVISKLGADAILNDYKIAYRSREASLLGRKEVLSGKAQFGIFGDGKEVAQVALAHAFQPGDFRSGYYRDQTLMYALGISSIQESFAQLYAHADIEADPASAGRSMNSHFSTRYLHQDGSWKNLVKTCNSAADISPTGAQMPRTVGLAYASRLYRQLPQLQQFTQFSHNGNEVAFATIGDASCAEGMFWEALNAIGALKSPAVISVWDDGYGISVPSENQLLNVRIAEMIKGFQRNNGDKGYEIYLVKGWDYPTLIEVYLQATELTRKEHIPTIIHVTELTQPQGHSTSGSHERYKSAQRLAWEQEYDCLKQMRNWLLAEKLVDEKQLCTIEEEEKKLVATMQKRAWKEYVSPVHRESVYVAKLIDDIAESYGHTTDLHRIKQKLLNCKEPCYRDLMVATQRVLIKVQEDNIAARDKLIAWRKKRNQIQKSKYASHLFSESPDAVHRVPEIKPVYNDNSPTIPGFKILNACFDAILARDPRVVAFGEDVGYLGDVNQGFAGLQKKYGELRVSDTGIRECTIIGQAIGLAMRGLRPIAEIQYLDYLLYALQIMSDDLATIQYRTKGGQKAPVIVRTRGHRLVGIWHSGSPMAAIIHLLRGIHVLVPRNMTKAAGFYNTMLQSDEPALIVEVLNAYRFHEKLPTNIGEFCIPLGKPEILRQGSDVTVVTYGATCKVALEAAELLQEAAIDIEVIDAQTLLPFDTEHSLVESLKKTNRIVFLDEDVPGGTTAYMMQQVLEQQEGYYYLDSKPLTITAAAHRPAYGIDGDYWSKPQVEHVFCEIYTLMRESDPKKYPDRF